MSWKVKNVNMGQIKPHTSHTYTFEYTGNKKIVKVNAGCSCTVPSFSANKVTVTYTAPEFPKHLVSMNKSSTLITRNITIHFSDGTSDILNLKGTLTL